MSDKKYIAIQLVAEFGNLTFDEREALENKIMALLGCTQTETNCPMILYASTVVDDAEVACNWLH